MTSSSYNDFLLPTAVVVSAFALYTQSDRLKKHFDSIIGHKKKQPVPAATTEKPAAASKYGGASWDDPPPRPTPLESLTPDKVKSYDDRPWRPFRWPYHQTMSVFRLDINHWLDMDKFYINYLEQKQKIFDEHGTDHFDYLPESEDACEELLETVVDHMLTRYPNLFKKTENGIHNLITDEKLDLSKPLKDHPLSYISKLAKEDFYVVKQRDDGLHYLVAAAVPFPGGYFKISDKLGHYIDLIHQEVPYYNEKLKASMERWFSKLKPAEPVERASWYFTWDHELLCSKVYMVPEGEDMPTDIAYEDFTVRIERQTLRRLPKSNAIIFTNHPVFYHIEEMKDEPGVPSILRKVVNEAPEKIQDYKNFHAVRGHLGPYLDRLIQRQIDLGIIDENHEIKTAKSYPFAHWVTSPYGEQGWTNPMFREESECPAGASNEKASACPV